MIKSAQIKQKLPDNVLPVITDRQFDLVPDEKFQLSMDNFIKHRHFLRMLKLVLDTEQEVTMAEVIFTADEHFGVAKPFKYVPGKHDCDNAAVEFLDWVSGKGWAVGMAIGKAHTLVVYFNQEGKMTYAEPQTGEVGVELKQLRVVVMT